MSGERSHTDVAGGVLLDEVLSLCFDTSASANPSVCRRNSWMGVRRQIGAQELVSRNETARRQTLVDYNVKRNEERKVFVIVNGWIRVQLYR